MSNVLEELEKALISEAQAYTPEGSMPKAIIHQWVHAISHDLPLFGEANGADKSVIIKIVSAINYREGAIFFKKPIKKQ